MQIAEDGEILLRGANIFQGYYKNEEATAETLADGWLHTGDLGYLDDDGFLFINGRKKDILITAGGKNITPANLENGIKQNRWVSQAVVVGDRRPYLVALLTLDPDEAPAFASQHGVAVEDLPASEAMRADIQKTVDTVNAEVGPVEQVKKFVILPHDLTQETGELTPTMKVKRNVVNEKYEREVEALYLGLASVRWARNDPPTPVACSSAAVPVRRRCDARRHGQASAGRRRSTPRWPRSSSSSRSSVGLSLWGPQPAGPSGSARWSTTGRARWWPGSSARSSIMIACS